MHTLKKRIPKCHYFYLFSVVIVNLFSNFKEYERRVGVFNIYEKEALIYKR